MLILYLINPESIILSIFNGQDLTDQYYDQNIGEANHKLFE